MTLLNKIKKTSIFIQPQYTIFCLPERFVQKIPSYELFIFKLNFSIDFEKRKKNLHKVETGLKSQEWTSSPFVDIMIVMVYKTRDALKCTGWDQITCHLERGILSFHIFICFSVIITLPSKNCPHMCMRKQKKAESG